MTLPDFLESLFSRLAKWVGEDPRGSLPKPIAHLGSRREVVDLVSRAPLFVLGKWDDVVSSIMDLRSDLIEDLADGLMAPFSSIAIAYEGKRGWAMEWVHRTGSALTHVHMLFHETQETAWFRNTIEFEFLGKRDGHFYIQLAPESVTRYVRADMRAEDVVAQDMGRIVEDALLRVALISHPENYVVKRTPKLTAREQRRVGRGELVPVRKRPYYVVLDHTGLVRLRQEAPSMALRLPLPHARRGHWMRLAERCRSALSAGKDRVWRRETYVGDRKFEDSAYRYNVFLSAEEAAQVQEFGMGF
jgi:hypothetical protein